MDNFFAFMTFLAPPGADAADRTDTAAIARGSALFNQVGCNGCHVRAAFTTPNNPPTGVPGNFAFHPFSDFLVHDMGSLGDNIGASAGESAAQARSMRTAPLWGLAARVELLHDGRTTDVVTAVLAHDGQAANARGAFAALGTASQQDVVKFVRSIGFDTE